MNTLFSTRMPDVTIPNGTTEPATPIAWDRDYQDAESITIFAPNYAETLKWQASIDGNVWEDLYDSTNTAVIVPAPSTCAVLNGVIAGIAFLRLHSSSGAVVADRTFQIVKNWRG